MNIVEVLAFYGIQFNDYWTTILGLRMGAKEKNPMASPFASSPVLLAIFKFGLGTFALFIIYIMSMLSAVFCYILFADLLGEAIIVINNLWVLNKYRVRK